MVQLDSQWVSWFKLGHTATPFANNAEMIDTFYRNALKRIHCRENYDGMVELQNRMIAAIYTFLR